MNRCRLHKFAMALLTVAAMAGCYNSDEATGEHSNDQFITFGLSVPEVATRVTVSDSANSEGKYAVTFDKDDQIGLYLYYNNFYEYYKEYNSHAESVIFANQLLKTEQGGIAASYTPLMAWTFSTIYGTSPYKYDAVAYYPYTTDNSIATMDSDTDTFVYKYDPTNFEKHCDFMTAATSYTGTDSNSTNFRTEILGGNNNISLRFTRQMASVNIALTKADHLEDRVIVIKGVTVHFTSNTTYNYHPLTSSGGWVESPNRYNVAVGSKYLNDDVTTLKTSSESWESDDTTKDLTGSGIKFSKELISSHLYFPPKSVISKIVFDITMDNETRRYTWHPHVKEIVANTHFLLNLELDPDREN